MNGVTHNEEICMCTGRTSAAQGFNSKPNIKEKTTLIPVYF